VSGRGNEIYISRLLNKEFTIIPLKKRSELSLVET